MIPKALVDQIARIAGSTPAALVEAVLPRLLEWDPGSLEFSRAKVLASIPNPQLRAELGTLIDLWQRECPALPGSAVAVALQAGLQVQAQHRETEVDLAWTGPETNIIPLRRTGQVLLQLIEAAQRELLIVSFAVYRVDAIVEALEQAIARGVRVNIVIEDAGESEGRIEHPGIRALGPILRERAAVYVWPLERRERTKDGRYGLLHAKIGLRDNADLFVSSANLTGSAMDLNMELGVLLRGGELPGKVGRLFSALVAEGHLRKV